MITSKDNSKIKHIRKLLEKSKTRREEGLFILEGYKTVKEAHKRGLVKEVYVSESADKEKLNDLPISDSIADNIFRDLTDTVTPQGIIAVVEMPRYDFDEIINRDNCKVLCLEDVRDPGNVGTIVRTAEGAGFDAVIMSKGCADVYQPKVVRSTAGAILRVPCLRCESDPFSEELEKLKNQGFTLYATHLKGSVDFKEPAYDGKVGILIGNEANGLSDEVSEMADVRVKIPMKGELESLNAAVSAALLAYEVERKNQ